MRPSNCFLPVLLAFSLFNPIFSFANDRIDLETETPIPRSKNLYGIGVGILPKTSGSDEYRALALPIINANYGDRFYINALQAGVWLMHSEDKRLRFGLAAEARFGWDADDGRLTRGMQDRDFSVDFGPMVRWQTDYGTINAMWGFDVGSASNGNNVQLQYIKSLVRGNKLRLNGMLSVTWNSAKYNDYYFGVDANEATPTRPVYNAGAGVQTQLGINGAYATGDNSNLLFGLMVTRLGNEQADSPIVETRIQPLMYIGYAWAY